MIFVVDRKDSVLKYQSGSIRIEVAGKLIQRVPINQLALVVIYGNPLAETAVWRNLAGSDVPTVMLSSRGKNQLAMIGSGLATQLPVRLKQHELAREEPSRLRVAKWFVDKKITAYSVPLLILGWHYQINTENFIAHTQVTKVKLQQVSSNASLMGVEGQYAHAWFKLLADCLPAQWKFTGRNRRPPKDPINALLSLSYTLMMSEVRQLVIGFGFDPALGFLHQNVPGRESLVLDVAEIFRAGVDYFVLQCVVDQIFTPDSFYYREQTGCQLSKQARAEFYRAWAIFRGHWPRRPLDGEGEIQIGSLQEQITGQLMLLRDFMKM